MSISVNTSGYINMSYINISDLSPSGSEFFQDSESFLHDLAPLEDVKGGTAGVAGVSFVLHPVLSLEYYPSVVQTKVTVSVAVSLYTASVMSIGY
ncbi:hypothetical protein IQ250_05725 [Pseudanabaenaceae cyanobacterium LEGE 13415]|nr:hypothetical protein [Pseudanabaenaceae cyanobacterium LEGE 13415]